MSYRFGISQALTVRPESLVVVRMKLRPFSRSVRGSPAQFLLISLKRRFACETSLLIPKAFAAGLVVLLSPVGLWAHSGAPSGLAQGPSPFGNGEQSQLN